MLRRATLIAAFLALTVAAPAQAGMWRWPVRGSVVGRFHYGTDPFAAGQRRGILIGARNGTPVRSACAGRVTFAGRVPRAGRTVSIGCGELIATYLHLGAVAVRAGTWVSAGDRIGAAAHRLHFGVRRRRRRFGYIDPLSLLGDARGRPPLPLAPAGRRGPGAPRPLPAPPAAPTAERRWRVTRATARAGAPAAVWVGLALAALALPGVGLRRRRRRRRAAPAPGVRARAPAR